VGARRAVRGRGRDAAGLRGGGLRARAIVTDGITAAAVAEREADRPQISSRWAPALSLVC
jgi:hypothetical protein